MGEYILLIEFHQRIYDNDLDGVNQICTKYPQYIDASHPNGDIPITRATSFGYIDIVKCLLEHGANPNAVNCSDVNALYLANVYKHHEIVKLLIQHKAIMTPSPLMILGLSIDYSHKKLKCLY